ncbi:hypothetical protein [Desulfonema magnum]|uniref:EF-hand domain-containing protein n=1 Tax=Desulfonema magnum TaxID=45655 RepID=A0A975GS08_9BACT|nr:hypothetical protein [Desulfonema magnum]QTA90598.1 Uncharacterized protein dnm_066590 [Desulfonema magnum]
MKKIIVFLFVVFLVFPTPSWAADWQDIRDAILGKEAVTQEMDVNKDGKVDVADVLKNLKDSPVSPDENGTRYIGTMSFDPQFALSPQSVDMTIGETGAEATFNVENSPFFPASFKMSGSFSDNMIAFDSEGAGTLQNGDARNPLPRDISWNLNITDVTPVTVQDSDEMMFQADFTMTYIGFKAEDKPLDVTGTLYLKEQLAGEGLSFEQADDMELLAEKYPVQ